MRSKKKNTKSRANSLIIRSGAYKQRNKKGNNSTYFPGVSKSVAVSYQVSFCSRFPPVRCPLQRRNHERYSWISAVLMNAIKRYRRELSTEYFSLLPKICGVCEIPGIKQRARRIFSVAAESTVYPAPPTTRSDGFLWTTTSSCCCNACSSSRNSSSTCCCNTRCCCQGKNVTLPASPRRHGVSSVHPQRYQGFDPTFTQDKTSYYIIRPRRFARNASYERTCFWRKTIQAHPKKS